MIGNRVKEHYYREWIYREDDGSWHFLDNHYQDHGPFSNYAAACSGVDEYIRRSVNDHNQEDAVGKQD